MDAKKGRGAHRFGGYGKALDTPPTSMPDLGGVKDRQAEQNRATRVNPDEAMPGNVTGCCSQPVSLGRKR